MRRKRDRIGSGRPARPRREAGRAPAEERPGAGAVAEWSEQIGFWLAVRGLLLAALGIAGYLGWHAWAGTAPVGCGPASGCDRVLNSRWAWWFGVPVSLLAAGAYSAMLWASFNRQGSPSGKQGGRRVWGLVLVAGAVAVLLMAVWFVGLQVLVLRAFCRYCLAAHLCGGVASALVLWVAVRPEREAGPGPQGRGRAEPGWGGAGQLGLGLWAGVVAAGVVVLGQLVHQPKSFLLTSLPRQTNAVPSGPVTEPTSPERVGPALVAAQSAGAAQPVRLFSFYEGRFTVNLHEVPVIGSPTNPQVVVSLFDYTCQHCQAMHRVLVEAHRRYSNQLVIVSLPMPLDPQCNPWVVRAPPEHTNACAYARLSLAVWRADRTKHREFDDWMFAEASPPPLAQAVAKASALVGAAAVAQAQQDPWIEQQLKLAFAVYGLAYQANRGELPQVIVGTNVALGSFPKEEFFALLERNLGLKAGP